MTEPTEGAAVTATPARDVARLTAERDALMKHVLTVGHTTWCATLGPTYRPDACMRSHQAASFHVRGGGR